jgi:low temperature requirement protein LtrA
VLTVVLNPRAYRHVPLARPLIGRYVVAFSFSVALWIGSLAVPEPWRFVVWGIGLAVDLGVPALIGPRFVGRITLHASHIPERFALFTMIVLGESVIAVALGVAGSDWRLSSAAGAALGFLSRSSHLRYRAICARMLIPEISHQLSNSHSGKSVPTPIGEARDVFAKSAWDMLLGNPYP